MPVRGIPAPILGQGPAPAFRPALALPPSMSALPAAKPQNSQWQSTIRTWNRRAAQAQQHGIPLKSLVPIAQEDFRRLRLGHAPLTNLEAAMATRARMTGQPDPLGTDKSQDSGFAGDVVNDIMGIGQSLNPVKLIPGLAEEAYNTVTDPVRTFEGLGHLAAGVAQGGPLTEAGTKELGQAVQTPGVRFIPGLTTAWRLGADPNQIAEHPIQTILDVLPLTSGTSKLVTRAAVGDATIAEVAAKSAGAKAAQAASGRVPEALQLSPTERIIEAASQGHPLRAGIRAAAPDASMAVEQGVQAFKQRLGFGSSARYLSRQEAIMKREAQRMYQARAKEVLGPLYKDLTPEDRQYAFEVATRPDLHAPGSYPEHIANTVEGTRNYVNQMALDSQKFGDHALTPVPIGGKIHWYGSEGAEGQVARSWQRLQKANDILEQTKAQLNDARTAVGDEALAAQEAKIAKLQEDYARQIGGRASAPAPPRPRVGAVHLSSNADHVVNTVQHWITDTAIPALRGQDPATINERIWVYDQVRNWYAQGKPSGKAGAASHTPVGGEVKLLKGLLNKDERASLVQALEGDGITHFIQRNGKEIDAYKAFGVPKPGRVWGRKVNETAAERTLTRLQDEKARLDSGEYLDAHPAVRKTYQAYQRRMKRAQAAQEVFQERFHATPSSAFQPMIEARILQRIMPEAQKAATVRLMRGESQLSINLPEAVDRYVTTLDPSHLLPGEEGARLYAQIKQEVASTWTELVDAGYDPVWIHNTTEATLRREMQIKPYGTSVRAPKQLKQRTLDPSNTLSDIALAVDAGTRQYVERLWHQTFIDTHVLPYTRTAEEVNGHVINAAKVEEAARAAKGELGPSSRGNIYERIRGEQYVEFHPEALFGFTTPKLRQYAAEHGDLFISRDIADVISQLMAPTRDVIKGRIGNVLNRTTAIFKMSVLGFSPKHMSDVLFADTMWLMLRGGKEEFNLARWVEAFKAVKEGTMPIELPAHIDQMSADQIYQMALGKKLGHLYQEHGNMKKALTVMYRMEEAVNNTQRMVSYLSEKARKLKSGADETAAHEAALAHAYRTLLDVDSLVPIERTILKQVFPFYSFMRYILSYTLTFPFDHPVRAAFINKWAQIEREDWDSGLPLQFQNYFFMGSPDATGKQMALDVRSLNPFRDLSNFFTFSGFVSQLNPLAGGALRIMGVNPLSATPELYPTMKYDPNLGRMVNSNPSFGESVFDIAKSVVPQAELLDYFGLMTQNMRELKASNPEAYRRVLFRNLFLPFTPRTIDIGLEKQKSQQARLDEASKMVSEALRTGQPLGTKYAMVPYQGKLVPAAAVNQLIAALQDKGASPKAIAPR